MRCSYAFYRPYDGLSRDRHSFTPGFAIGSGAGGSLSAAHAGPNRIGNGCGRGGGTPIGAPTSCQWAGQGKIVTLVIRRPLAGKSPVDQFNDGKARKLPGVTTEPVSGVGDDAFYVFFAGANRAGCGVVVKKGSSVFEVRVYGFDLEQAKGVAKTLAQGAAAKL